MRINLLIVLLLFPLTSYGQEIVEDTLDWRGYYPLEIGNIWEWKYDTWFYNSTILREIRGDTLINETNYFIMSVVHDGWDTGRDIFSITDYYLRYDNTGNRVLRLDTIAEEEVDITCDLSANWGQEIDCQIAVSPWGGGYYEKDRWSFFIVGQDTVPYASIKGMFDWSGSHSFMHGVGQLLGLGEGSDGTVELVYARLSGIEYGFRSYRVTAERQLSNSAFSFDLFPNPALSHFMVSTNYKHNLQLTLVDVLGREQGIWSCRQQCQIETASFSPGVYFVRVVARGKHQLTRPITIAR